MSNQYPYQNGPSSLPPGSASSLHQGTQAYAQLDTLPVGYGSPDSSQGLAIAGFVFGFLSLFLWIIPPGFWIPICVLLGLSFSPFGMKSPTFRGLAIAGLVLSAISLIILVSNFIVSFITLLNSYPYFII